MVKKLKITSLENIWYSTEKRLNSIWNTSPMDDTGEIILSSKRIKYKGKRVKFNIANVIRVYLSKQTPSYGAHAISFLISFLLISYTFLILYYQFEYFLVFAIIISILYPVSLMGVKSNWIGVEYIEDDLVKRAFFSNGSHLGWEKADQDEDTLYDSLIILAESTT